jgi:NAD(P)H-flavin reductase
VLADLEPAAAVEPMLPRRFEVHRVSHETADTVTLELSASDGRPLAFTAGQFTMIGSPTFGEVPISISGDPAHPDRLVHTVRGVGDATTALLRCRAGDRVLVRGPYGRGWEVADGAGGDVLVVAGGIGLAPLRPALLEMLADRHRYGRVTLVYGSRSPADLLYRDELERWRARPDLDVAVTVDGADSSWRGHVGLVTTMLPESLEPANTLALLCGPEVMMRLAADALVARGMAPSAIRVSMERNMKCGVGLCGHCQLRELFVCLDGPVLGYDRVGPLMTTRGL